MGLVPLPCSLASKHALWHKGAASGQPACQSAPRSEGTHCPLRRSKSGNYRSFPACLFIAITSPFLAHKEVMGYVERSCGFHHKRSKFIYLFIYLFVYFGGVGGYRMPLCLCMAIWDALLFYPLPKMLAPLHRVNPLKNPPTPPPPPPSNATPCPVSSAVPGGLWGATGVGECPDWSCPSPRGPCLVPGNWHWLEGCSLPSIYIHDRPRLLSARRGARTLEVTLGEVTEWMRHREQSPGSAANDLS